jgi:L-ascorbate metabolism protein UlaG (beta-lactamase superfamily)
MRRFARLFALSFFAAFAHGAVAQEVLPEACPQLLASNSPRIIRAALAQNEIGLTFTGHATFLIETPAGLRVATDYNDFVRPPLPLDIITMNKAHGTHFTHRPPQGIAHVLRGWNPIGGAAAHDLTVKDMRVRNVVTNIRDWAGGTEYDGNSIFVFESREICIAHLGHLHHELQEEHLKRLGRIDVVLVPVDGSMTLDVRGQFENLRKIAAPLVIPMHYFNRGTLERFLRLAREVYEVEFSNTASITLTRDKLPIRPKVLVLPGQ